MRLLLTGASGQLGAYLLRALRETDIDVTAWSGSASGTRFGYALEPVNLTRPAEVEKAVRRAQPNVVIHAAALSRIAACYQDPALAQAVNVDATAQLASLCAASGTRLVFVSTDLVFDGSKGGYTESDPPAPLSIYGQTKTRAEQAVLTVMPSVPGGAVVRVSLLVGPSLNGRSGFFDDQVSALRAGTPFRCFVDEWRTPLPLETAAQALLAIARSPLHGTIHLGGPQRLNRWEMACISAKVLGLDPSPILRTRQEEVAAPESRPKDTSLNSSYWRVRFAAVPWPKLEEGLREMYGIR